MFVCVSIAALQCRPISSSITLLLGLLTDVTLSRSRVSLGNVGYQLLYGV